MNQPKGVALLPWAFLVVFVGTSALKPDTIFKIGFSGPDALGTNGPAEGTYYSTLVHEGGGAGAQGWSLSLTARGGKITSIDTVGTATAALFTDGFSHHEVTNGVDNEGAISAIILSFTTDVTLPVDTTSTLARLGVRAGPGPATLLYVDGLTGVGQPVANVITQAQASRTPTFVPFEINAPPPPSEPEACAVSLGDKVGGALQSPGDQDAYEFSALDGTLLALKLKGTGGNVPPGLQLRTPQGSSIDLAPFAKVKKTSVSLKNLSLPGAGAYKLLVTGGAEASPNYLLTLKGKAPRSRLSLKANFTVSSPGEMFEQSFSGLGGALLTATLKGKKITPDIVELLAPNGQPLSLGGALIPGAKSTKIQGWTIPSTGAYVLRVRGSGPEGSSGALTLTLKQKPAQGRVLAECAE